MPVPIDTGRQTLESLSADGGIQIQTTAPLFGGVASPFPNVTVQKNFLDGVRAVTSFQTYAPTQPIRTEAGQPRDDVYGRIAGSLAIDLGNGLSGMLSGSTSFARESGEDRTVSVGLRCWF